MSVFGGKSIPQTGSIVGYLSDTQSLVGELAYEAHLIGSIATVYSSAGQKYDGDYEVTPTVEGMELNTKDRYMVDDVKINAIPFFEVSNTSGGNTVYIAGEIEME